ncbi:MAG: SDR family oxidoreductase [Phycisphaerales bacterium]|nr:SDR family oxidoreductase [Phycisphaerales bacterium]
MGIDLKSRTIAITGASSGIGKATAIACSRAGMRVIVGARREDELKKVVEAIRAEGGDAAYVVMDVSNPKDNERLVEAAMDHFGSLYSVFANAGYGLERSVLAYTDAELDEMFRVNFWSCLQLMRLTGNMFLKQPPVNGGKRGHILVCSSCVSKIGLPNYAAYSATKSLQDHFARAMRIELADQGVAVSSVHPIGTKTEFFDTAKRLSGGKRISIQTPERFKQPAETVANAIVRCLRKPKGEVWTSFPMRAMLALGTAFPGLADAMMLKRQRQLAEP